MSNDKGQKKGSLVSSYKREIEKYSSKIISRGMRDLVKIIKQKQRERVYGAFDTGHFLYAICPNMSKNPERLKELIEDMKQVIRQDPVNYSVQFKLGVAYGILGHHSEAIEIFKEAIRIMIEKLKRCQCDLLIVEDEESIRCLLGEMFQEWFPNMRIQYAKDGIEGFSKAKALQPRIVWTCVKLPLMSGLSLIELIRQDPELKNTKIIVYTAFSYKGIKNHPAFKLGVNAYLFKGDFSMPVEIKILSVIGWCLLDLCS